MDNVSAEPSTEPCAQPLPRWPPSVEQLVRRMVATKDPDLRWELNLELGDLVYGLVTSDLGL